MTAALVYGRWRKRLHPRRAPGRTAWRCDAPIQNTDQIAEIATALRASDERVEEQRLTARQQLEQRRRAVTAKMDR